LVNYYQSGILTVFISPTAIKKNSFSIEMKRFSINRQPFYIEGKSFSIEGERPSM